MGADSLRFRLQQGARIGIQRLAPQVGGKATARPSGAGAIILVHGCQH